jgi:predicted nucleic acid-binding protein
MPLVIDVSVMANWHFADERNEAGANILAKLRGDTALVPGIWWFELRNVILSGERRGRSEPEDGQRFLDLVRSLPIEIANFPDEATVLDLARRHRLSFYDACYVELAKREKMTLATFDNAMAKAAQAENVALIGV